MQTNGWGGHSIPSGSFTSDTYLWIRFTTNGGNADGRFHKGWTGTYQKYWPYVSGKKKRKWKETPTLQAASLDIKNALTMFEIRLEV